MSKIAHFWSNSALFSDESLLGYLLFCPCPHSGTLFALYATLKAKIEQNLPCAQNLVAFRPKATIWVQILGGGSYNPTYAPQIGFGS